MVSKLNCNDVEDSKRVTSLNLILGEGPNFGTPMWKQTPTFTPPFNKELTAAETVSYKKLIHENTKVIVAAGMFPAANLLLDSFEDEGKRIGNDYGAHFCSSVLARIPRDKGIKILLGLIKNDDSDREDRDEITRDNVERFLEKNDFAEAIYIHGHNGVEKRTNNPGVTETRVGDHEMSTEPTQNSTSQNTSTNNEIAGNEWHAQLSVIVPTLTGAPSTATLARLLPGGPDSLQRVTDPNYVYFNFSMLGEILTRAVEENVIKTAGILNLVGSGRTVNGTTMEFPQKNNGYKKITEDDFNRNYRRSHPDVNLIGGLAALQMQLSKLDYTTWETLVRLPPVILRAFLNSAMESSNNDAVGGITTRLAEIALDSQIIPEYLGRDGVWSPLLKEDNYWNPEEQKHPSDPDYQPIYYKYRNYSSTGTVHEGCILPMSTNPTDPINDRYQYYESSNTYVVGSGLLNSTGSWNPTGYLSSMAVDLADIVMRDHNGREN